MSFFSADVLLMVPLLTCARSTAQRRHARQPQWLF
jgi:hypothetical protein